MKLSPSMLACDFSKMGEEIVKISNSGADMIHMDIMDGHFVPNISFGPSIIKSLRNLTNLIFDVHLMITDPEQYVNVFLDYGADIITFHLESNQNPGYILKTIDKIKSKNKKVGLAIKPQTKYEALLPYLKFLDLALVMTVEPGFGGQKLLENQLLKTELLKKEILSQNLSTEIQIDGGVNLETIGIIKKYPIDICVSGTCVFKSQNISETVKILKS